MKKRILLFYIFLLTAFLTCAEGKPKEEKPMTTDKKEVRATYRVIMDAMVAKDRAMLEKHYAPDMTFRHMSGKVQTRSEYFDDIVGGKLNYYKVTTSRLDVKTDGKTAEVAYTHTLDALAYGARGAWPFSGTMYMEKRSGVWVVCPKK